MAHSHRRDDRADNRKRVGHALVAAAVAAALATTSVGVASAAPEQAGVTPSEPYAPQQGGVTPEPTAPPEESVPQVDTGPGIVPDPPQEAPYRAAPDYDYDVQPYTPPPRYTPQRSEPAQVYIAPQRQSPPPALHAPVPTPPVRPIAPPDEHTLRIGRFVQENPPLSPEALRSINRYAAFGEAKIAQSLMSVGVSPREADRQAASTIVGVVLGGTVGAATLGIPLAVVGAAGGAALGGGIGALVPPTPFNAGPGALIGAAAGAAALGVPAAVVGFGIGGALGGGIGYALGAGNPSANPEDPTRPEPAPAPEPGPAPAPAEPVSPATNQYEAQLISGTDTAPAVDYTVDAGGDVSVEANLGGIPIHAGVTAEQAEAPYKAIGAAEQPVKDAVATATQQVSAAAEHLIPGLQITIPGAGH